MEAAVEMVDQTICVKVVLSDLKSYCEQENNRLLERHDLLILVCLGLLLAGLLKSFALENPSRDSKDAMKQFLQD